MSAHSAHIPETPGVVDARSHTIGSKPISALEPIPEDNPDALPKMHQFGTYADLAEFLRTTPQNARSLCVTRTPTRGRFAGWTFISKLIDRVERRESIQAKRKVTGREVRVVYANGDIEVFPTIRLCADAMGVHPQNISQKLSTGLTWKRGKNKGCRVEYADTDGTGNIVSRHT